MHSWSMATDSGLEDGIDTEGRIFQPELREDTIGLRSRDALQDPAMQ